MIQREQIGPGHVSWHLNRDGEEPWPFRPVLHEFTGPDVGPPHDHLWHFLTTIVHGWYEEEVYELDASGWRFETFRRGFGDARVVTPDTVHRIIDVSPGGCFTSVVPFDPPVRSSARWYELGGHAPDGRSGSVWRRMEP